MSSVVTVAGLSADVDKPLVRICILGGGYAGSLVVRALEDAIAQVKNASGHKAEYKVTLVDRHEFLWMKISGIRASVDPKWVRKSHIPISDILRTSTFVCGDIVRVDGTAKSVLVKSSEGDKIIPWDILICCTGTTNGSPTELPAHVHTSSEAQIYLNGIAEAVKKSKQIVIVGGGATSIEYAGEIRSMYPDKEITIICASGELLASCVTKPSAKFLRTIHDRLRANNIRVLLGHRSVSPDQKEFGADSYLTGHRKMELKGPTVNNLEADLVIWAGSWKFNNSFYPEEWINEMGELDVSETFQLTARSDVFAFGDITSLVETKQAIVLPKKIPLIVNNIMVGASSFTKVKTKFKKMKKYSPSNTAIMYLPIGANDGASSLKGWTYGPKRTSTWKGKHLFIEKFNLMLTGRKVTDIPIAG